MLLSAGFLVSTFCSLAGGAAGRSGLAGAERAVSAASDRTELFNWLGCIADTLAFASRLILAAVSTCCKPFAGLEAGSLFGGL